MARSHDASCEMDWLTRDIREQQVPNRHYTFIHASVLPALKAAGVDDEQIDTMMVQNPGASFTAERT